MAGQTQQHCAYWGCRRGLLCLCHCQSHRLRGWGGGWRSSLQEEGRWRGRRLLLLLLLLLAS